MELGAKTARTVLKATGSVWSKCKVGPEKLATHSYLSTQVPGSRYAPICSSAKEQRQKNNVPFFTKLQEFRNKVAISDQDGDFLYEDVFRRSFKLAQEIKQLTATANGERQRRICLICPNGLSYVVGQWGIWMSGNTVVPISGQHSPHALEYFIKDSQCSLVIAAQSQADKVSPIATKLDKEIFLLGSEWTQNPETTFDEHGNYPTIDIENLNCSNDAMLLYSPNLPGPPRGVIFGHEQLNSLGDLVTKAWDLNNTSSVLSALNLQQTYGIVASLIAPLSVGGSVVLLSQFDSIKVWAHLLGIQLNGDHVTRVNVYPAVPTHYEYLYKRYQELFNNPKMKEYVLHMCTKRIQLMTSGCEPMSADLMDSWQKATGHCIFECSYEDEVGQDNHWKGVKKTRANA